MPSVAAARDGSSDQLALNLPLLADFRNQADGTVIPCSANATGLLFVLDTSGAIVDCRGFGPDPGIWVEVGEGG